MHPGLQKASMLDFSGSISVLLHKFRKPLQQSGSHAGCEKSKITFFVTEAGLVISRIQKLKQSFGLLYLRSDLLRLTVTRRGWE
jgi:hypothetical protein